MGVLVFEVKVCYNMSRHGPSLPRLFPSVKFPKDGDKGVGGRGRDGIRGRRLGTREMEGKVEGVRGR